ncbi:hypothetical protein [Streptomyces sp. MNU89]|uniref:hypothetical protein n=1 Tax=Streptomyces sp. MNU89 TaxID=2560025 RepID=UPI001E6371A2|nr:hypothetical protein [Streptomyces sp. MNU89]MCC9742416.1 hypothetical protein [Streptomyces sp. MNU89]
MVRRRPERWDAGSRDVLAHDLLERLTPVMSGLGLLFLLVVVGERMAEPGSGAATALAVAGWLLWGAFAAEFAARLALARHRGRFLRRNGWQIIFLVLPFLRVLRLLKSLRLLRTGRVLSSTLRSSRSAGRILGDRAVWLSMVSLIVVVAASELLWEFDGAHGSYAATLHATALMTISGEPVRTVSAYGRVLQVLLAVYSVVVVAALAGTFGAYFVEKRAAEASSEGAPPPTPETGPPRTG